MPSRNNGIHYTTFDRRAGQSIVDPPYVTVESIGKRPSILKPRKVNKFERKKEENKFEQKKKSVGADGRSYGLPPIQLCICMWLWLPLVERSRNWKSIGTKGAAHTRNRICS